MTRSLTDVYLRLEQSIRERDFTLLAWLVIAYQASAALLLLVLGDIEGVAGRVIALLVGSGLVALGALTRRKAPLRGRILAQLGAVPGIEVLIWLAPPVGIAAAIIFAILVTISFVV